MLALNTLAIGVASIFAIAAANHGPQFSRAHHHNPLLERSEHHLQKRFSGRATYYEVGMGACGITNVPSDDIVALNTPQYGDGYPGPNCFKMITICANGKCVPAQITDQCPGCPYGALDMSEGLFTKFASTDAGVFQMTWSFNDGNSDPTTKQPDPPKTTSSKKPDPPKTTWVPPTTTKEPEPTTTSKKHTSTPPPETTSTPEPTTSTSSSTSAVPTTTSTSEAQSTTSTTSVAAASPSPSATPSAGSGSSSTSSGSNWADMAQAMLAMGRLATVAHSN